jgi:hypothetical protein
MGEVYRDRISERSNIYNSLTILSKKLAIGNIELEMAYKL